jgi:HD superfamily phosphodiesterase
MSIPVSIDSPLECLFIKKTKEAPSEFPSRGKDYVAAYKTIKEHLANKYYQVAGAGLSEGKHRFTKHDITHVDDVIQTAGRIMGLDQKSADIPEISAYETFILLIAILVHDAGNAYEREGHEIKAAKILKDIGSISPLNQIERTLVASIASAHGGKKGDGSRDTIEVRVKQDVSEIDGYIVNGRRLAALVRLADEFSERSRRADDIAIETKSPPQAYLPNFFCRAINVRIDATSRAASMDFHLEKDDLTDEHPDPENNDQPTLIVDYIAKRLNKADLERRYCNRYLVGWRSIDVFRSTIAVHQDDVQIGDTTNATLSDTGYPTVERKPAFKGEEMKRIYCGEKNAG